jgi:hypothetical protein
MDTTAANGTVDWNEILVLVEIILVIVIGGGLGGLVNFILAQSEVKAQAANNTFKSTDGNVHPADRYLTLPQSVTVGITAAFLVPLFLSLIQSTLLTSARTDIGSLLIFAGFCVAAGIGSRTFVRGIADRISRQALQLAEEAKQQSSQAAQQVEDVQKQSDTAVQTAKQVENKVLDVRGEMQNNLNQAMGMLMTDTGGGESILEKGFDPPEVEIHKLENEYNRIRKDEGSGPSRTFTMTRLVHAMIDLFKGEEFEFDVLPHLRETSDMGKRLSGYAYLNAHPDFEMLDELITSAQKAEAFGQYWGIQAIGESLKGKRETDLKPESLVMLDNFLNNIQRGTDRYWILSQIREKLKA